MAENKRYTLRSILISSVWIILGAGLVVLLVAAISKKNTEILAGVEIHIQGVQNLYFVNKQDVLHIMEKVNGKKLDKEVVSTLDLVSMENELLKDQWISEVKIFFDNNNVLQVRIMEREPVARIFTVSGESYYLDNDLMRLPLSEKFSARLPVFTNFPANGKVWSRSDSIMGNEIKLLGDYIVNDPFWMAQVDQVDITSSGKYELIPKLGNQVIRFGGIENYKEKFNKLMAFYSKVQTRTGWNRYSVLDIQYKDQVVAIRRDAREIKADSLRAIQVMKEIIEQANVRVNDSTQVQMPERESRSTLIQQSREIDLEPTGSVDEEPLRIEEPKPVSEPFVPVKTVAPPPVKNPAPATVKKVTGAAIKKETKQPDKTTKPPAAASKKPEAKEPVKKAQTTPKPQAEQPKPKAVMPPKNE